MITDIYSKREKKIKGEVVDVYEYDSIPLPLRIQTLQIIREATDCSVEQGLHQYINSNSVMCETVCLTLRREYGVTELFAQGGRPSRKSFSQELERFFMHPSTERAHLLDVVELSFQHIESFNPGKFSGPTLSKIEAIEEFNFRFREHGVGISLNLERLSDWIQNLYIQKSFAQFSVCFRILRFK